jgi:hypothetical protein
VLAYLFWHRPAPSVDPAEYESRLAAFHARLRAAPPEGFRGSAAFAVDAPWGAYEDWYLTDDWRSLGVLGDAAVDAVRGPDHDPVARQAAGGAGGVYALRAGDLAVWDAGTADWSAKPPGTSYPDWEAGLLAGHDPARFALWQRQLVLGPAPEFCLLQPGDALHRVV